MLEPIYKIMKCIVINTNLFIGNSHFCSSLRMFKIIIGTNISGLQFIMLGVMGILCIPTLLKGRLQRWQGILLLAVYAAFTIYQFVS